MSLSALIAIAAASVPGLPAAPPIVSVGPSKSLPDGPPVTFDVEVRTGNEIAWAGPMRVSLRGPALFNRQKEDAPAVKCPDVKIEAGGNERNNLRIYLSRFPSRDSDEEFFSLSVEWTHPGGGDSCGLRPSSLSSSISQRFALEPGKEITATGDGGLSVRIRRR